jgi:hypothetical protein
MSWCVDVVSTPKNMITIINAVDTLSMENEVIYMCVCVCVCARMLMKEHVKFVLPEALLSFTPHPVISSYCFFFFFFFFLEFQFCIRFSFVCHSLLGISFSVSFVYK